MTRSIAVIKRVIRKKRIKGASSGLLIEFVARRGGWENRSREKNRPFKTSRQRFCGSVSAEMSRPFVRTKPVTIEDDLRRPSGQVVRGSPICDAMHTLDPLALAGGTADPSGRQRSPCSLSFSLVVPSSQQDRPFPNSACTHSSIVPAGLRLFRTTTGQVFVPYCCCCRRYRSHPCRR